MNRPKNKVRFAQICLFKAAEIHFVEQLGEFAISSDRVDWPALRFGRRSPFVRSSSIVRPVFTFLTVSHSSRIGLPTRKAVQFGRPNFRFNELPGKVL